MPKRNVPRSFDGWLGKVIDDEAATHGGRAEIARWIGVSEQSVNRRSRGESPYLAREVTVVSEHLGVSTAELVTRALRGFGGTTETGLERLLAESVSEGARTVSPEDNITYLGHVTPPLQAAADQKPRVTPKE